jgi:uncharacterized membrane protein
MLLIAILPMTVSQVATVTADSMSYGLSFLWISMVLETAVASPGERISKRMVSLVCLALALSQLRPPYPLLGLLVLLIPISRFGKRTFLLYFAVIAVSLLPALAWNRVAARLSTEAIHSQTIRPLDQARWVLIHPGIFWHRAKHDLATQGLDYWQEFVGRLGWLNISVPSWISVGFAIALGLGIFVGPRGPPSPLWWQRLAMAAIALGGIFAIEFMLYLTFNPVKSPFILGVQGRYFTALAVLAAFAFSNSLLSRPSFERIFKWGCLLFGVSAHCGALFAVARASGKI